MKVRVRVPVLPEPSVAVAVIVYVPLPSEVKELRARSQLAGPPAAFWLVVVQVWLVLFQKLPFGDWMFTVTLASAEPPVSEAVPLMSLRVASVPARSFVPAV